MLFTALPALCCDEDVIGEMSHVIVILYSVYTVSRKKWAS